MAVTKWPPDLWMTLFNTGSWPDTDGHNYAKQLIPLMDVYQWLHDFGVEFIKIIPHHPPEHRRTVYGQLKAFAAGGAFTTVDLGQVGYDAIKREVIWAVNERGGWQKQEMRLPISSVLPVLFQLLIMIPWDVVGEVGAGFDQSPNGTDIGRFVYDKVRTGLQSVGIFLPVLPGMGSINGAGATAKTVTIPADDYTFTSNGINYELRVTQTLVLHPGRSGVARAVALQPGYDPGLTEGSIVKPVFNNVPTDLGIPLADNLKCIVGNQLKITPGVGVDSSAVRWAQLHNTNPTNPVIIPPVDWTYTELNGKVYVANIPAAITVPVGGSVDLKFVATTIGVDTAWNVTGVMPFNRTVPTPSADLLGQWFTGPAADPAVNGTTATAGSADIVIKNDAGDGATLLPSLATLLLYNIPVMDLCQAVYDAASELVEAISHHPPYFEKTVWAGGVKVAYEYELWQMQNGTLTRLEEPTASLPNIIALQGKTLRVYAKYSDDAKRSSTTPRVKLFEKDFAAVVLNMQFGAIDVGPDEAIFVGAKLQAPTELQALPFPVTGGMEVLTVTQGVDDSTDAEGNFTAGTSTVFTARLIGTPDHSSNTDPIPVPGLAQYEPMHVVEGFFADAVNFGETTAVVGDPVSAEVFNALGESQGTLTGTVTAIVERGQGEPSDVNDAGAPPGTCARVAIVLANDTLDAKDIEVGAINVPTTIAGKAFNVVGQIRLITVPGKSKKSYTAAAQETTLAPKGLVAAEILFSAPLKDIQTLVRWQKQDDMGYIGEEFNIGSSFTGDNPPDTSNRFHQARFGYRTYNKRGQPELNWTYEYTPGGNPASAAGIPTPHGVCQVARIQYNAVEKSITVISAMDGSAVKMRSNAAIWFIIQHILMIPISVT